MGHLRLGSARGGLSSWFCSPQWHLPWPVASRPQRQQSLMHYPAGRVTRSGQKGGACNCRGLQVVT